MGAQTALGEAMDRNAADKLSQASGNEVHHYCMPAILNPSESFLLDPAYRISIQINGAFFFSLSLSLWLLDGAPYHLVIISRGQESEKDMHTL